ncbi:hypothetical protein FSARC_9237 [Fusarium sarcochroum]|uniref:Transmembrane protein n=1 Tax=Fusarium sarcochroum TaxID=1208366 RepID=A0A8H4TRA1_9HYPO|nr:hypothetical protein FSARC_9237 [Fusarium sarcochroum]
MLSLKHHVLFWALSFLILPLTSFREYLTDHELFPELLDDPETILFSLTIYILLRLVLPGRHFDKSKDKKPEEVTTFTGNVTAAQLDEPPQENGNATEHDTNDTHTTGAQREARVNKGRKRFITGTNGRPRQVQYRIEPNQNGNARQSNRNRTPQNPSRALPPGVAQKLKALKAKEPRRPILQALSAFFTKYLELLYFVSVVLLCTRADFIPGFENKSKNKYVQPLGRVFTSFMVLGTLEPFRLDRWDIESCGLGMFRYCCTWCNEGTSPCASLVMGFYGLMAILAALEGSLYVISGDWVNLYVLWFRTDYLTIQEMFVRAWLLSPLIDITETTIYTIARFSHPEWHKMKLELVQKSQ